MPLYDAASTQRIGVEVAFPTLRLRSDANDAVPFGDRILRAEIGSRLLVRWAADHGGIWRPEQS
jgi:hypothetical protein